MVFFSVLTGGIALIFYVVTIALAASPAAEGLWRKVEGVRPLRLKSEKERLLPLFNEVYEGAMDANPEISEDIDLYIKEDMTINAFAFGKGTLVLTRGSIELLSDECLQGLMAHEFGHFSHRHTEALLLFTVANLPMSFIIKKLTDAKNHFSIKRSFIMGSLCDFIYYLFKGVDSLAGLLLMYASRRNEYVADGFTIACGFGEELTEVLTEIYGVAITKPQSVKEQFRSTHPHITLRIEQMEAMLD